MVKKKLKPFAAFILLAVFAVFAATSLVNAQSLSYYFGHEYAKIYINPDRTIDLTYDRSLTLQSGSGIHWVEIGQPKGDFTLGDAVHQYGHTLSVSDTSSGSDYKVRVNLYQTLQAGQTINFSVTTNVAGMISNDTLNPGNVGMQFAPAWDTQETIYDVRIMIVLPPNVTKDVVKTTEVLGNIITDPETGRVAVYWEKPSLAANEQYLVGVSFPANYIGPETQPSGGN